MARPELAGDQVTGLYVAAEVLEPHGFEVQRLIAPARGVLVTLETPRGPSRFALSPEGALELGAVLAKHGRIARRKRQGDRQ